MGLRYQVPHDLVLMPELRSGTGQPLEQVGQIELVSRTRRSQDAVAQRQQQRMDHHLGGEGGRLPGQARDVPGLGVEELDPGVQMPHIGIGGVDDVNEEICLHDEVEPYDDDPARAACAECGQEFELTASAQGQSM